VIANRADRRFIAFSDWIRLVVEGADERRRANRSWRRR
jgi:hypothetical protein